MRLPLRRLAYSGATEFGFQRVASGQEKTERVKEVFRSVADKYDLMNDLMSVGVHRYWKDQFVGSLRLGAGSTVLDVAGGTGDIAFRCVAAGASVTVLDINERMLEVGRQRAAEKAIPVEFVVGNAESLPVADGSVDVYTIAFGLRNVSDIPQALREARRVLKLGGRFACLEFSQVEVPLLKELYSLYSFEVIPRLGEAVTGDRGSYEYLVESIARFPSRALLSDMLMEAGFEMCSVDVMSSGVVAVHSGYRIN